MLVVHISIAAALGLHAGSAYTVSIAAALGPKHNLYYAGSAYKYCIAASLGPKHNLYYAGSAYNYCSCPWSKT